MRRGFTMIELIFVIVIIGILASIAIPKLAATRDDAIMSKELANLTICITDAGAYYTATGNEFTQVDDSAISPACNNLECFHIGDLDGSVNPDGSFSISNVGTNTACVQAHTIAGGRGLSSADGVTHSFSQGSISL